jgi:hypothetical protein
MIPFFLQAPFQGDRQALFILDKQESGKVLGWVFFRHG